MNARNFKSVLMLTVMLAMVAGFSACSKDDSDARDVYIGSYRTEYTYTLHGVIYSGTYTLTVVKSSTNENDIILNNIDNSNESVRATVTGTSFNIPQQTILDFGISGSGTLKNGNLLDFSTTQAQTGGTQLNTKQTATKQ